MSLNLTIDQGNTVAKMALWNDDVLIDIVNEPHLCAQTVERFASGRGLIDAAIYCSVSDDGKAVLESIRHIAKRVCRLSSRCRLPIKIDYGTPGTLGADRIAAAVGAVSLHPDQNLLVVDAGTAVTYDFVTADGTFRGGNITPGLKMRLDALHRYTARLPQLEVPTSIDHQRVLGKDTADAMILGAVYGIVGAVSFYMSKLRDTKVVMTGGNAPLLSPLLDFEVDVEEHLVSKGLNRILLYNEDKK